MGTGFIGYGDNENQVYQGKKISEQQQQMYDYLKAVGDSNTNFDQPMNKDALRMLINARKANINYRRR